MGRLARQRVPQVQEKQVVVRVPRRACGHVPWIAEQVRVLEDEAQRTVVGVLPKRLVETDGAFLDGPVLAVGGFRIAVAHQGVFIGGIDHYVPSDVVATVVGKKDRVMRVILEAVEGGIGMYRLWSAARLDGQVGSLAEQIPAATVADERIDDHVQTLHQFQVEVGFAAASLFGEACAGEGIESLKRAEEARELDVEQVAVYLRIRSE